MNPINQLFRSELKVINLGLAGFKQALDDARVPAVQVDWKPSVEVEPKLLQRVRAAQPAIERANARVMKIILGGMPHLVGLEKAIDVIPGMKADLLLQHATQILVADAVGHIRIFQGFFLILHNLLQQAFALGKGCRSSLERGPGGGHCAHQQVSIRPCIPHPGRHRLGPGRLLP